MIIIDTGDEVNFPWWAILVICVVAVALVLVVAIVVKKCIMTGR